MRPFRSRKRRAHIQRLMREQRRSLRYRYYRAAAECFYGMVYGLEPGPGVVTPDDAIALLGTVCAGG